MENLSSSVVFYILLFLLVLFVFICYVIAEMARQRGRSGLIWVLLSFVFSPFLCMVFLYFLGETDDKREEWIITAEQIKMRYKN
ncbi:hypothetical protein [Flavobacterium suzhouense]|uniref:Cardiolipin synthase N-terminal domain-containing protein n=1 Tax=Flavobacterium suzhouense TaxID=1529638 RepID=A0ABW5NSG5_9FLAO